MMDALNSPLAATHTHLFSHLLFQVEVGGRHWVLRYINLQLAGFPLFATHQIPAFLQVFPANFQLLFHAFTVTPKFNLIEICKRIEFF